MIVGQKRLKETIQKSLEANTLPRFIIIVGQRGSGKKTLIREVFGKDGYWLHNVSVNSVREMIEGSYHYHDTVFIIPDADTMSQQAKMALLKVVEECPNNNRYIMTLENLSSTLTPIQSRAAVYRMEAYTLDEIEEYARWYLMPIRKDLTEDELKTIQVYKEVCDTPADVIALYTFGGEEFYAYVEKVVDNIATVSGANAFKISDKLSVKDGDGKYDLKLFFRVFMAVCVQRFKVADKDERLMYASWCSATSEYMADLGITGINRQSLIDNWILRIRELGTEWNYQS